LLVQFGQVLFFADTAEDVDQFIRDYVLDAIGRVDESGLCDGISFDRDEPLNPDGESVGLIVASDFDTFVEHEQDHWAEYRDAGLITDWKTRHLDKEQLEERFGEHGFELTRRLTTLAGQMEKLAYEEFAHESFPPAEDAYPEERSSPAGWWTVPHHLTAGNLGYSPREEIRMYRSTLDEHLRIIAERDGPDAVDDEIDGLIDALEGMRDEVKEWRPG
jgi:hypothetical protein